MAQTYWFINSNRTLIKRFIKNINSEDRFYNYMFIYTGNIFGLFGNESPLMQKREELKFILQGKIGKDYWSMFGGKLKNLGKNLAINVFSAFNLSKVIKFYAPEVFKNDKE